MSTFLSQNVPKISRFICEKCQYQTDNKKDYSKHILTRKHTQITNFNNLSTKNPQKSHTCNCGKKYKERTGLWKHKKICEYKEYEQKFELKEAHAQPIISENTIIEILKQNKDIKNENNEMKEMFMELLKGNKEMCELMIEQNKQTLTIAKKGTNINNNNCHNTNNKFNLQFFLNEQCKDALNIMDFVNDLQVKLTDLENVGRLGYSEGISKIFINGLKQLDVFKRPIHCSDLKREVLYIKDEDVWEKENEENKKIKNAISHISHKNIKQITKWTEEKPNYKNSDSKENDEYLQIIKESMSSSEIANIDKVIHNIAREVVIEK